MSTTILKIILCLINVRNLVKHDFFSTTKYIFYNKLKMKKCSIPFLYHLIQLKGSQASSD